jgi:hypothetical protein
MPKFPPYTPLTSADADVKGVVEHKYDKYGIPPKDFLNEVVWDPRLPMPVRIDAAKAVAVYEHPRLAQQTQDVNANLNIRIHGGLPALPGTNIIMPSGDTSVDDSPKVITPAERAKGHGHGPD